MSEQRKPCTEVPPGNGYCDMCASGRPALCRYINTIGAMAEIDRLLKENAELKKRLE